jgi:hypothetical protein
MSRKMWCWLSERQDLIDGGRRQNIYQRKVFRWFEVNQIRTVFGPEDLSAVVEVTSLSKAPI